MYSEIIRFWFEEIKPEQWWIADAAFDASVRNRFSTVLHQAMAGELFEWRREPQGRLAEIIVLDQFSRNIYRHTPQAFAQDPMALVLSQEAVELGVHKLLTPEHGVFLLMPFMHSESKLIHQHAEMLFKAFTPAFNYEFELKHKAIIDRFGRYPHRNAILGRESSTEELEFLKQPGSSF